MQSIQKAIEDISLARKSRSIWLTLGWNDARGRYHRSKLGVLWANLSLMMLVFALGPVYSKIMGVSLELYLVHLLLGLVVWNYVSSIISESGREFINSTSYLVSFQLSYFTLLMRVVWRNFIILLYQMVGFVLVALIFRIEINLVWASVPLALLIITLNALWMGLIASIVVTRYRDFDELINNIIRLIFFVTPIMWIADFSDDLLFIANANPFYHLIEILRAPLAKSYFPEDSWFYVSVLCVVGWSIALPLFVKFRSRLSFWL